MSWRTVIVNKHSKLSYKNHHLFYRTIDCSEMIHLSEIDVLIIETTDIMITNMLLTKLAEMDIVVIFCDQKRMPKSILTPLYSRHDSTLQITKQIAWQEEDKIKCCQGIVGQKIRNQASHLREIGAVEKEKNLLNFINEIQADDITNREGHAARTYFNCLFGTQFTREEDQDINHALNYGYTLVLSMFSREIVKMGCLTQIGIKHINQYNHYNFASDLMEPFRVIIDQIVYEHRDLPFRKIKRQLLEIFYNQYSFKQQQMYLTNIIEIYTRQMIQYLNRELDDLPVFEI